MNIFKIQRPVVNVMINGKDITDKIHKFTLTTDSDLPHIVSQLEYSNDFNKAKPDDSIQVTLSYGQKTYRIFSGHIFRISNERQKTVLHLIDGFVKLWTVICTVSYRKEKAKVILTDIIQKAGLQDTEITCPDVEFARFSTQQIPVSEIIKKIIETLKNYGYQRVFRFFFDTTNTFRFGTLADTGKNPGERFAFETGVNIIEKGDSRFQSIALPIRHSQEIEVDKKSIIPNRTKLIISKRESRITIWGREAD